MIVMIFEYRVHPERYKEYLDESAALRPLLQSIGGFISVERFESNSEPGRFVSIGYFKDESAVTAWRNTPEHRRAQAIGRNHLFVDYRLRMANITRDYSMTNRDQAPPDSRGLYDI